MLDLSVIIINWNTRELLRDCIRSIYNQSIKIAYEIIVVDNGSIDGTIAMLSTEFPNVRVIANERNKGFAKANNQALRTAVGKYFLLLNSDTKVLPDALDAAVAYMRNRPEVGALAFKILNQDGTVQHPCYTGNPNLFSEFVDLFYLNKFLPGIDRFGRYRPACAEPCEVAHATGACLLLRKSVLDQIGHLDEAMVFSYEDADICRRIRARSWKVIYQPQAAILHYGNRSAELLSDRALNMIMQSKYHYFYKYYGPLGVLALGVITILGALLRMIVAGIIAVLKRESRTKVLIHYLNVLKWHFFRLDPKGIFSK
jgi:GT2 family glycosyltransferase